MVCTLLMFFFRLNLAPTLFTLHVKMHLGLI